MRKLGINVTPVIAMETMMKCCEGTVEKFNKSQGKLSDNSLSDQMKELSLKTIDQGK